MFWTLWEKFVSKGLWRAVLPRIPNGEDQELKDYCLIAGGLNLVLSRFPPETGERQFPAAWALRARLCATRQGKCGAVAPELISDASHEIAEIADRLTKDALLRRLRARPKTVASSMRPNQTNSPCPPSRSQ